MRLGPPLLAQYMEDEDVAETAMAGLLM